MATNVLYHTEQHGTQLLIVSENKTSRFQKRFPQLCNDVLKNPITKKFRRITVLFQTKIDLNFKHISGDDVHGYVSDSDIKKGTQRVHINEQKIIGMSLNQEISEDEYSFLHQIVIHEIAHLWLRKHLNIDKIRDQFTKRIHTSISNMFKTNRLFSLNTQDALFWGILRKTIEESFYYYINEGMPTFIELLDKGEIDFDKTNLNHNYSFALEKMIKIEKSFDYYVQEFIHFLESNTRKIPGQIAYNRDLKKFIDEYVDIHYKSQYPNFRSIGLHLFQTIFYANPELNLEDVAKMHYAKIIETYEKSCKMIGIRPVYSFNDESAIFCRRKKIEELTRLRKKYS